VVTVGGGEDGQFIVDSYLSMLERFGAQSELTPHSSLARFFPTRPSARCTSVPAVCPSMSSTSSPTFSRLLKGADLVVAMGGINRGRDSQPRPPGDHNSRESPRREHSYVAERLSALKIVGWLRLRELTATGCMKVISQALRRR